MFTFLFQLILSSDGLIILRLLQCLHFLSDHFCNGVSSFLLSYNKAENLCLINSQITRNVKKETSRVSSLNSIFLLHVKQIFLIFSSGDSLAKSSFFGKGRVFFKLFFCCFRDFFGFRLNQTLNTSLMWQHYSSFLEV